MLASANINQAATLDIALDLTVKGGQAGHLNVKRL